MIGSCVNQYKQAAVDCDNLVTCAKARVSGTEDKAESLSYINTARSTAAFSLSLGIGCLLLGSNPAACCLIPGTAALVSSELPVCAICVTKACQRAAFSQRNSESKEISIQDKQTVAVDLNSLSIIVYNPVKKSIY